MARFEAALARNPAPHALGDVSLRYEPSMLIGETPKARRTLRPTVVWGLGVCSLVVAVGLIVSQHDLGPIIASVGGGAVLLLAATWLERFDRGRRAFIVNFATSSLRLDFATPLTGYPGTLVVHFDGVRSVDLRQQLDGAHCLTVDFTPVPSRSETLREVLVAHVSPSQLEAAERLRHVLEGAFGLGEMPHDSPYQFASAEGVEG